MDRLKNKVAIITGGAGGIGAAAGRMFAAQGAKVLLVDRDADALAVVQAEAKHPDIHTFAADVSDEEQTKAYVEAAIEKFGRVDILLANAGIEGDVKPISDYPTATFDQVIAVNVRGVWLGIKHVAEHLVAQGKGSIVVTSSTAGVRGTPGISPYTTSKHAVIGMTKSLALEFAPKGVRINTVNPCPVETRMMRSLEGSMSGQANDTDATKARITKAIPLGRYGDPDDIAKVMLFLASDDASFVTGAVYMADGGSTA
ncbi:MAG: SDR family oxidoreductase [Gammaproteobacteria bacterium]|nr:SDR family oxidoreductase [Gammaproteobacteria bacterium]